MNRCEYNGFRHIYSFNKKDVVIGKIVTTISATLLAALVIYVYEMANPPHVVVFTAPTLQGVVEEVAESYPGRLDSRVLGSVLAASLIRAGQKPDLFLTVDHELAAGLEGYRHEILLGRYRLQLVCRREVMDWRQAVATRSIGLSDPNTAPIGYRAIAAIYLIDRYEKLGIADDVMRMLNIELSQEGGMIYLDAADIRPSGRFHLRRDLSEVGALLEAGVVDCIFAHAPYVYTRKLDERFRIFEMPWYAQFLDDPPVRVVARIVGGREIVVGRFVASAISFTEKGDLLLSKIQAMNLTKYQILPIDDGA
jgi:molybdate/tungstate transport system substrate-binding protein